MPTHRVNEAPADVPRKRKKPPLIVKKNSLLYILIPANDIIANNFLPLIWKTFWDELNKSLTLIINILILFTNQDY